ncbi:hypothetical protein [Teredinibacter turnerae]|uniref:hypothetical protein n=1 Tax=Teredinibacter turnerae TaxID=2426 RepID=UPI00039F2A2F|nr:hypothetical protein [Teredinibacter turnerae]
MTERICELMSQIKTYHSDLADRHALLSQSRIQSERVSQMAEYLSDWERKRERNLDEFIHHSDYQNKVETWLKEKPEIDRSRMDYEVEKQLPDISHTEEGLIGIVSAQHNFIADTYTQLEEISPTPEMAEFFGDLAENERQALRTTVRSLHEFNSV